MSFKVTVRDTARPGEDFVMGAADRQTAADDAMMYVALIMQKYDMIPVVTEQTESKIVTSISTPEGELAFVVTAEAV